MQRAVGLWVLCCASALGGCGDDESNGDGGPVQDGHQDAASSSDAGGDEPTTDAGLVDPGTAAGNENRPEGVAHCYTALSGNHVATAEFWAAFRGGKLEEREAAIEDLTAAGEEHPDEEEFALLAGLANLWRVAEPRPDEVDDMGGLITAAR